VFEDDEWGVTNMSISLNL